MQRDVSKYSKPRTQAGFSILEPLLAASLIAFLVLAIVSALVYGRATVADTAARGKALLLADEGLEAVRRIRADGFTDLEVGVYGLSDDGGTWALTLGSDITDGFERTIEIADMDDLSKSITSTIEWAGQFGNSSVSVETRLYDWQQI